MKPIDSIRGRRPVRISPRRQGRRSARGGAFRRTLRHGAILISLLALGGCVNQLDLLQQQPVSCSERRLDVAAALFEESKDFMLQYFEERDNSLLLFAYYSSKDAEDLTKSIRNCNDFDRDFKARGTELIRATRVLRRVVVLNMRDPDPAVMAQLLGSNYNGVFKSDIR